MKKSDGETLFDEAKGRYKHAMDVDAQQRLNEKEDLMFQVAELQWDDEARRERGSTIIDNQVIPARPTLSVSKIAQPMAIVLNQIREADLGVRVSPLSADADEIAADTIQGIYLQIERDSRADIARLWAADRAIQAGRGYYRVSTRYADEVGGNPFDQVITINRILHQEAVVFDPAADEPDFSDAMYAFITSWVPWRDFKRMYGDTKLAQAGSDVFSDPDFCEPSWVKGSGDSAAILVCEYFFREMEKEKLYRLKVPIAGQAAAIKKDDTFFDMLGNEVQEADLQFELDADGEPITRDREIPVCRWAKLSAGGVIEGPVDWNGRYIPIITVLGDELQPFDERRRWQGMVRPARDPQKAFNYGLSTLVERTSMEPKAPWVGMEGQFEGHEEAWQASNRRNLTYLQYRDTSLGDRPVPPPQRTQVDTSALGPSMVLMEQATSAIQSAMATFDPSLGQLSRSERSGRAIQELQDQSDISNSDIMQQLANVSMKYESKVVMDLIPVIYDRPGRIVRILDDEEKTSTVMLGVPYTRDPRTKMPVQVLTGPDGQLIPPPPADAQGTPSKIHDAINLQQGTYSVTISIGKAFQTRLQQGALEMGRILERMPELMKLIGPEYFRFRDFPGADKIAKILTKVRDMEHPNLMKDDDEAPTPEQAVAENAALKEQLQQLQQAIKQAQQAMETDQAKQQAMLQKAQLDNETKLEIARMDAALKLKLQEMEGRLAIMQTELDAAATTRATRDKTEGEIQKLAAGVVLSPPQMMGGE